LRLVLPLRHWEVATTMVPLEQAFLISGIMFSFTWPRPDPDTTTPSHFWNTPSKSIGSMPG